LNLLERAKVLFVFAATALRPCDCFILRFTPPVGFKKLPASAPTVKTDGAGRRSQLFGAI
jgi:hypothetical protein